MTVADRAAVLARLERFAREHPGSILFDGELLLDVASGKTLPLDVGKISRLEERRDRQSGRPYLALGREDGGELALADQGIVFPPVTTGTGPIDGLPDAVSLRDLAGAEARLEHFLVAHPGEPADRTHVSLFLLCLAIVDGARAVGFDVSREERRLEAMLNDLEARRRG